MSASAVMYEWLAPRNFERYQTRDGVQASGYFDGGPPPWPWDGLDLRSFDRDTWGEYVPADLHSCRSGLLGMSAEVAKALEPILAGGELLPATIEGEDEIWLYHCRTRLEALDPQAAVITQSEKPLLTPDDVNKWAFDADVVRSHAFFRDHRFEGLFATDTAAAAIEANGFRGARLLELWNDEDKAIAAPSYPWQDKTFSTVGELITYERDAALPGETFDETLYRLLCDQGFGCEDFADAPESVVTYFAQRMVQYRVVTDSMFTAVQTPPNLMAAATSAYRSWGLQAPAEALELAVEHAFATMPDLIGAAHEGQEFDSTAAYRILDEDPALEKEFERLEASVPYETWSADSFRLDHVRRHREDFLRL